MRTLLFTIPLLVLAACSQEEKQPAAEAETVSITIPSVQCSLCEDAITEALTGTDGVTDAKVDLDAKTVTVTFKTASLKLGDVENVITKAGYDANDKKADPEAYEGLPGCCKLPEEKDERTMDSM